LLRVYLYTNLKVLRKKNGWTQDEMQEQCGIQRSTWSNYENGYTEPSLEVIAMISGVFKISLDDLILKDLRDAHLNDEAETPKKPYATAEDRPETTANEPDEVGTWAILGQLKRIEEKIDRFADFRR